MAIETAQQVVNLALSADETMSRLVQWCESQGLACNRSGPNQLDCRMGEKSVGSIGRLMLGSFSNMDSWPVKVLIQVQPDPSASGVAPPVQVPTTKPKFCFNCGATLSDEGRFCPGCGSPVPGSEESPDVETSGRQVGVQVTISASHDIPTSMMMGQIALGPFKEKYEQHLAQIILRIQQAWG